MNQMIAKAQEQALQAWFQDNPWAAVRGLDEPTWNALCSTIYPGAKPESILLAADYCRSRGLDVMLKPVHLVPMQVKDAQTNQKDWRDVPMPGIGLYRIQADRSGNYAGADDAEYGPVVEAEFIDAYSSKTFTLRYPEWCRYTVYKMVGDTRVAFTAREYWLENYATQKSGSEAPNSMWKKRPFAQLGKCAEAQALRKAWPEIGATPTAEEMEGKTFEREINPREEPAARPALGYYPAEQFDANFPAWKGVIEAGKKTPEQIIQMVSSKALLTDEQKNQINEVAA